MVVKLLLLSDIEETYMGTKLKKYQPLQALNFLFPQLKFNYPSFC